MYTCKNCGSDRVQRAHWVMMNTREIHEPFIVAHNTWCIDCESHAEVVDDLIRVFDEAIEALHQHGGFAAPLRFLQGARDAHLEGGNRNPFRGTQDVELFEAYESGFNAPKLRVKERDG